MPLVSQAAESWWIQTVTHRSPLSGNRARGSLLASHRWSRKAWHLHNSQALCRYLIPLLPTVSGSWMLAWTTAVRNEWLRSGELPKTVNKNDKTKPWKRAEIENVKVFARCESVGFNYILLPLRHKDYAMLFWKNYFCEAFCWDCLPMTMGWLLELSTTIVVCPHSESFWSVRKRHYPYESTWNQDYYVVKTLGWSIVL